jgi:hypothetical protein
MLRSKVFIYRMAHISVLVNRIISSTRLPSWATRHSTTLPMARTSPKVKDPNKDLSLC